MQPTQNLHVKEIVRLLPPRALKDEFPMTERANQTVVEGREVVKRILRREDPRLLVVVGPCSIHDLDGALEYARKLNCLREQLAGQFSIVMRVYFEKPRTTIGWKGLINDPHLDGSYDIETGWKKARRLLLQITGMGLPAATEFLDPIVPQYLADLVSWAAIGARTTESQTHREMASGLSMPVGFKNATDGSLQKAGLPPVLMVACSHANSGKQHARQEEVWKSVLHQRAAGNTALIGLMVESYLEEGSQPIPKRLEDLRHCVSITDACIGWETTERMLRHGQEAMSRTEKQCVA